MRQAVRWTLLSTFVLVVGAASASAGPAPARGSSDEAGDKVIGCIDRQSGKLRIVASGSSCTGAERRLAWNRRGPTGPRGATGAAGAPGTPGAPGAAGVKGEFAFDSFDGMPCTDGTEAGSLVLTYDSDGFVRFTC